MPFLCLFLGDDAPEKRGIREELFQRSCLGTLGQENDKREVLGQEKC